jgi:hypothetical protein
MISSSSLFGRKGALPLPFEACWTTPLTGFMDLALAGDMARRGSSDSKLGTVLGDIARPFIVGFGVDAARGGGCALPDGLRDKLALDA